MQNKTQEQEKKQKKPHHRGRRKENRVWQRNVRLISFLLLVVALLFAVMYFVFRGRVKGTPDDVIYNNVYVESVNVSGMKKKEASEAIQKKIAEYQTEQIALSVEADYVMVTLGDLGFSFKDADHLAEKAVSYGKTGGIWKRYFQVKKLDKEKQVIPVEYTIDAEMVKNALAEKAASLEQSVVNASIRRENGGFVITDEEQGRKIDLDASVKMLEQYLNTKWNRKDGSVALTMVTEEPTVKRADLETIQDALGSFTTYCGSGGGRVKNIQSGTSYINGKVVMPGEIFSADGAMRPYTAENGYAEAGSYENGKVVQSMGGGICQVSTTLYNAVIKAELEVTQRQPHSMLVAYVEPAMDAAIAGDYKDLKFKNNTATPIYIEGYISGGNLTFTIYGKETRPENRSIKFVSETLETIPAGSKFEATGDAIGTMTKAGNGHTGKKSKLWKVVYEDGKEVSREVFNTSNYSASPAIFHVGTASSNAEASAIVKAAVATQNEGSIKNAIAEAKAKMEAAAAPPAPAPETPAPAPAPEQ